MDHPFFRTLRVLSYYLAMWMLVACIHFAVLVLYSKIDFWLALTDSLAFNLVFAILGLTVWYVVRFSAPDKSGVLNIIINHLAFAVILLFAWIGIVLILMFGIFSKNQEYLNFLLGSLPWRIISGVFFYSILVLIYYINIYYTNLQERILNEKELIEMVKQAELDALKSQINPHFLFNSLNSISSLTITNPEKAQEMIIKLSEFLRYNVSQVVGILTTLEKELENTRRYLDIEKVRFGDKLVYNDHISGHCKKLEIPSMILQPLYENCVKHGVYESTEPITITTNCEVNNDVLVLTISNNFDPFMIKRKGAGIGLKNIRERLKLIYHNDQLLKIHAGEKVFEVKIFIPQDSYTENT